MRLQGYISWEANKMKRQLKKLDFIFSLHGTKFGIPLCCIIFFESVWRTSLRADNDINSSWYNEDFSGYETRRLKNGDEMILCPECVIKRLKK